MPASRSDVVAAAIERIPYLRLLPDAERNWLAERCEIRSVPPGGCAFEQDEPASGVFVILEGRTRIVRSAVDGREQILHEEGPGATLGEVPVFDGEGYIGSAIAADDLRLLFVPQAPLLDVLARNPDGSREVIRILAARVRRFATLVDDLSLRSVPERVARYLVRASVRAGTPVVRLPATRDELAAHLGTVREQVSRALADFRRQRLIEVDGRDVRVVDSARLRRRAAL